MINSKFQIPNSKINKEKILEELKTVLDPELGINIVDLGLVYDVVIKGDKVKVKMTLTTPGCPLSPYFAKSVEEAVLKIKGVSEVQMDLVFEPAWSPEKMSQEAKIQMGWGR